MTTSSHHVVAVLATLDTKAEAVAVVCEEVRRLGREPFVVDLDPRGEAADGDATAERSVLLARAAARGADELRRLQQEETLRGVIGLGGGTGTWLVTHAVSGLSIDVPKLLVSTVTHLAGQGDVVVPDLVLVPSITDIAGMNPLLRRVLLRATRAVCAMPGDGHDAVALETPSGSRPMVALTMFGVTTAAGDRARELLTEAGYDVLVFHANGQGGRTMEQLIDEGWFRGVLDLTTSELTDDLVGGRCSAGPHRLESAARRGIPQVVSPGAVDVINMGDPAQLPSRYRDRVTHLHRADSVLVRTSAQESEEIGRRTGLKLAASRGGVRVTVPLRGFSALDSPDGPFGDPQADAAYVRGLRATLPDPDRVVEVDGHINHPDFVRVSVDALLSLLAEDPEPHHRERDEEPA